MVNPTDGHTAPPGVDSATSTMSIQSLRRVLDPRAWIAGACVVAGFIALVVGWWGVSGTLEPGVQMSYLVSGGLGGIALVSLGGWIWSSSNARQAQHDLADLRHEVIAMRSDLAALANRLEGSDQSDPTARSRPDDRVPT